MTQNKKSLQILAYTAGIIDGEGCISLVHQIAKHNRKGYSICLRVQVSNTNEWLCNWLRFQFGGSVGVMSKETKTHKECYQWYIATRKAYNFLSDICPYLQIKRPQAELALQFQKRRRLTAKGVSDEELILDEADKILMSKYNHKGSVPNE